MIKAFLYKLKIKRCESKGCIPQYTWVGKELKCERCKEIVRYSNGEINYQARNWKRFLEERGLAVTH